MLHPRHGQLPRQALATTYDALPRGQPPLGKEEPRGRQNPSAPNGAAVAAAQRQTATPTTKRPRPLSAVATAFRKQEGSMPTRTPRLYPTYVQSRSPVSPAGGGPGEARVARTGVWPRPVGPTLVSTSR